MDSEQNKQAVADQADPQPTQEAEGQADGARNEGNDSWDELLAQFEQETSTDNQASKETAQQQTAQPDQAALDRLNAIEQRIEQQEFQKDMGEVVSNIRGDLPNDVFDDAFVEAWIDAQARRDPRLQNAWVNRRNDPKRFGKVVNELGKQFGKKFSDLPDKNATEDREAVTQAVRGATQKSPEGGKGPDYSGMSDAEFRNAVAKEHGFNPL